MMHGHGVVSGLLLIQQALTDFAGPLLWVLGVEALHRLLRSQDFGCYHSGRLPDLTWPGTSLVPTPCKLFHEISIFLGVVGWATGFTMGWARTLHSCFKAVWAKISFRLAVVFLPASVFGSRHLCWLPSQK